MNEQPNKPPQQQEGQEPQFYAAPNVQADKQASELAGYDLAHETAAPEGPPTPHPAETAVVDWEASEYVHHSKGALWLLGLIGVVLVFAVIAFVTQAWTFLVLVMVMGIALGIIAFRPPKTLHYTLTSQGVQIDNKFYEFDEFRSFGIISEGSLYSIMLIPTKRFMPAINIFFEEQDGEKIVDVLGSYLPMEQLKLDAFDKLMRNLRF